MTEIVVNPRHNNGINHINIDTIIEWLSDEGLKFNRDYGVGWDWTDDVNLLPVIAFDVLVDPRIITAFALKWS